MNRRFPRRAAGLALALSALASWPVAAQVPAPPFDLSQSTVVAAGKSLFNRRCAGKCHGLDAYAGEDAPSLRERSHLMTPSIAYIMINYGRPGTPMVGWQERLPDEDIWRLAAYVASLQNP